MNLALNKFCKIIISFLLIVLPISLITGSFLSDLSVVIISLAFIFLIFDEKLYYYFNCNYSKIFFLFIFLLFLSSILSTNYLVSLQKTFFFIRFFIFSLAIIYILNHNKKILEKTLKIILFCFLVLIFDGYYQFFFEQNIFGWKLIDTRISSFFKDELILGSYLSRIFPILFALYIYFDKKINILSKLIFFLVFILVEVLIFLSGERVAFFYLNFSTIFLLLGLRSFRKVRFAILIFSLLLITLISYLNPSFKERVIDKTLNQTGLAKLDLSDKKKSLNQLKIFSTEHTNHYKSAYLMFLDNKLFGIGPRMFRENCNLEKYKISFESCTTHPHNIYVQMLSEVGLVGFFFLVFLLGKFFYFYIKHLYYKFYKKKDYFNDVQLVFFSTFLIILWPLVPTGGVFNNWLNIIYFYSLGMFLWSIRHVKE